VVYDEENRNACLSLRQAEILQELANYENLGKADEDNPNSEEKTSEYVLYSRVIKNTLFNLY
jgi:hypothetical protein